MALWQKKRARSSDLNRRFKTNKQKNVYVARSCRQTSEKKSSRFSASLFPRAWASANVQERLIAFFFFGRQNTLVHKR